MQHGDIWRGLDELAARFGLSTSGLARLAGLDATAFNKSKRQSKDGRLRWPTTESISRVLAAVNVDFAEFALLVTGGAGRQVPVLRQDSASEGDTFEADGALKRDPQRGGVTANLDLNADAYLFEITEDDYAPRYRKGDQILVAPGATLKADDHALLMTADNQICLARVAGTSLGNDTSFTNLADEANTYSTSGLKWASKIVWVRP